MACPHIACNSRELEPFYGLAAMERLQELRVKNGLFQALGTLGSEAGPLAEALLSLGVKGLQLKVLKLLGQLDEAKLEQLGRLLDVLLMA